MEMTLGKYVPLNTPIHRLDARVKIIALISFMIMIFMKYGGTAMNFIMYGILFVGLVILMLISKVKFSQIFKSLKAMWMMVILLLIINVLLPNTGDYFELWAGFKIYYNAIYNTLYIVLRLVLMIAITTILTATTKPLDLTYGLEWLLIPLRLIKIPTHIFAMVISLALRFIPTILEETERIMKAQASRGVDFKDGKLKEKMRAIISIIVPLFSSAIERSFDLADAMESRGYDPNGKRTKYRPMKWKTSDFFNLFAVLIFLGLFITVSVTGFDFIAFFGSLIK